ncbi:hypothetical protein DPQ22_03710 [Candidatus Tokpelaia sp.]|nr:hypothetical protein DPQ22_03710 [Candidatus Tokpelaia sp.]
MQTAPGLAGGGRSKEQARAERANRARVGGRRAQQRTGARKRANSARVGDGGRSKEQARASVQTALGLGRRAQQRTGARKPCKQRPGWGVVLK